MAHEIAKLILEHADTFVERQDAIRTAMNLGMRLDEIEAYLDWLDAVQTRDNPKKQGDGRARYR
jgi:hypothetical protein